MKREGTGEANRQEISYVKSPPGPATRLLVLKLRRRVRLSCQLDVVGARAGVETERPVSAMLVCRRDLQTQSTRVRIPNRLRQSVAGAYRWGNASGGVMPLPLPRPATRPAQGSGLQGDSQRRANHLATGDARVNRQAPSTVARRASRVSLYPPRTLDLHTASRRPRSHHAASHDLDASRRSSRRRSSKPRPAR
jgi:hypothetical protein